MILSYYDSARTETNESKLSIDRPFRFNSKILGSSSVEYGNALSPLCSQFKVAWHPPNYGLNWGLHFASDFLIHKLGTKERGFLSLRT